MTHPNSLLFLSALDCSNTVFQFVVVLPGLSKYKSPQVAGINLKRSKGSSSAMMYFWTFQMKQLLHTGINEASQNHPVLCCFLCWKTQFSNSNAGIVQLVPDSHLPILRWLTVNRDWYPVANPKQNATCDMETEFWLWTKLLNSEEQQLRKKPWKCRLRQTSSNSTNVFGSALIWSSIPFLKICASHKWNQRVGPNTSDN